MIISITNYNFLWFFKQKTSDQYNHMNQPDHYNHYNHMITPHPPPPQPIWRGEGLESNDEGLLKIKRQTDYWAN